MTETCISPLTRKDTHGFVDMETCDVLRSSDGNEWKDAFISVQSELPYKRVFPGCRNIMIAVLNEGSLLASIGDKTSQKTALRSSGSVSIVPDRMDLNITLHNQITSTHLYVKRATFDEVAGELFKGDPAKVELIFRLGVHDPVISQLCQAVRDALDDDPQTSGLYVEHIVRALSAHLMLKHSGSDSSGWGVNSNAALGVRQLANVQEMIESGLCGPLTISDFSREFGMSSDHFGRLFKQATGMPVHKFVLQCRLGRARRLLSETTMPISQIAFECGFSDQVHLTRSFRRLVGTTPAAFRHGIKS